MMVADPKTGVELNRRPPLLPSENGISNNQKKQAKSRVVSSRYMSPSPSASTSSSSRRYPSPSKRSLSADRRRPPHLDLKYSNAGDATKLLVTSTRSLSVSFQGEAFSLPIKLAPSSRRRTATPVRDQPQNPRPSDHHRWPATNSLSRSMDFGTKLIGSGRALQKSIIDERRPSLDFSSSHLLKTVQRPSHGNSLHNELSVPSDHTASDSDSVSSGSTSGVQDSNGVSQGRNVPRGIVVSARFWQETNSRLRRLQDPGSPLSTSPASKLIVPPKLKRYNSDGPLSSPRTMSSPIPRTMSSPVRGGIRPASPSKLMPVASSPSRGHSPSRGQSPSRIRNAVSSISNNFSETPSVLSFAVDIRRGKVGENRIIDAHLLRLLYNRHLQWRFVNARTEAVLLVQKRSAEKNLWNAWITISDLRDTVTKKRHRLQLLRQKLKLASILRGQMTSLEDWASLDKDHSVSLLGAIEALKASTLRLPVGGGAIGDVQSLKHAVGSAYDVMQAMTSSICTLLPEVEEVNTLVTELAEVTAKERALLEQCTDFVSLLAAMQVKDSSLRTHILQHNRVPPTA